MLPLLQRPPGRGLWRRDTCTNRDPRVAKLQRAKKQKACELLGQNATKGSHKRCSIAQIAIYIKNDKSPTTLSTHTLCFYFLSSLLSLLFSFVVLMDFLLCVLSCLYENSFRNDENSFLSSTISLTSFYLISFPLSILLYFSPCFLFYHIMSFLLLFYSLSMSPQYIP